MRNAETTLKIIRDRGERRLPLERVYRLLYNLEMYLCAYGQIYQNKGAMTAGTTAEKEGKSLNGGPTGLPEGKSSRSLAPLGASRGSCSGRTSGFCHMCNHPS